MKNRFLAWMLWMAACAATGGCSHEEPLTQETWAVGVEYLYTVSLTTEAASGELDARPMFNLALDGTLAVQPLKASDSEVELLLRFRQAEITTTLSTEHAARLARVADQLQRPHRIQIQHGDVTRAWVPRDQEAVAVGLMRNLAAHFQTPPANVRGVVEVPEHDATGRYVAEYKPVTKTEDTLTLERRKLRYLSLIADDRVIARGIGQGSKAPAIAESSGELTLMGAVPLRTSTHERVRLELLGDASLQTTTDVRIALTSSQTARALEPELLVEETVEIAADAPYVHQSGVFDLDDAKIGGRTFDEVISALESLARERDPDVARMGTRNEVALDAVAVARGTHLTAGNLRHFIALAALMRRDEANVNRAVAIIRGGSLAESAIASAMGAAGTPRAQEVLLELMKDKRLAETTRVAAAYSLLRTPTPTAASAQALVEWLHDPRWHAHATLGLGTFVRRFGEAGDLAAMERFGGVLTQELTAGRGSRQKVDALIGLSNSGYVGALPRVRPHLADSNAAVRAAALQALRLMHHDDIEGLLIDGLRDAEPEVRLGALEAIRNREHSLALAAAVVQVLQGDADVQVRVAAVRLIGMWLRDAPKLRDVIVAAAQDEEVSVRQVATSLLKAS